MHCQVTPSKPPKPMPGPDMGSTGTAAPLRPPSPALSVPSPPPAAPLRSSGQAAPQARPAAMRPPAGSSSPVHPPRLSPAPSRSAMGTGRGLPMSQVLSLIAAITSYSVKRVAMQLLQNMVRLSVLLWYGASDEVMICLPKSECFKQLWLQGAPVPPPMIPDDFFAEPGTYTKAPTAPSRPDIATLPSMPETETSGVAYTPQISVVNYLALTSRTSQEHLWGSLRSPIRHLEGDHQILREHTSCLTARVLYNPPCRVRQHAEGHSI